MRKPFFLRKYPRKQRRIREQQGFFLRDFQFRRYFLVDLNVPRVSRHKRLEFHPRRGKSQAISTKIAIFLIVLEKHQQNLHCFVLDLLHFPHVMRKNRFFLIISLTSSTILVNLFVAGFYEILKNQENTQKTPKVAEISQRKPEKVQKKVNISKNS